MEYERYIQDWWLVVLHNNKIERVLSNTKKDNATIVGDVNNTHKLVVELLLGESYDFYAFANLPEANQEYLKGLQPGNDFDKKQVVASIDAKSYNTGSIDKDGPYFPMSSYKYTVKEIKAEQEPLEIPLIRLLGKVSVEITNSTNSDKVAVESLTLGKFRTSGSIYLLPYDEAEDKETQYLLEKNMENDYLPQFPEGDEAFTTLTLVDSEGTPREIAKGEKETFWCYANETNFMAKATGLNNLQVTAKITNPDDGTERDDSPKDTDFDFIRRNDWLKIPMQLSDVNTEISFEMQHMPIGGLPATITIPEGLAIPQATFWTQDHGGDITITYRLISISSLESESAKIVHYGEGDTYKGGEEHPFTSAVLESNENLLINVPEDNGAASWLDASAKAFPLPAEDGATGSFTITTQELAKSAEARIRLNMVIEGTANGTTHKVLVPYTIIIKNQKEDSWTTTDGGN